MSDRSACLRPETIERLMLGQAPIDETKRLARHLEQCSRCASKVERPPAEDTLVEALRSSATVAGESLSDDVRGLIQRLETLPLPGSAHDNVLSAGTSSEGSADRDWFLAPAEAPNEIGRLERYRVLKKLGAGGMGRVFLARHPVMDRVVAIKVISPRLMTDPTAVSRFQREVQAVARLQHPNIVTAYDADQVGGAHFLVMEYVEGTDLARLLQQEGRLPAATVAEYIRQAALGLQHAHEQGMVHRDLKPSNLMLTRNGTVKIMDLGLARLVHELGPKPSLPEAQTALTGVQVIMGTPDYMAPEQARDARSADIRADIYSLGATLYHLLGGQVPFPSSSTIDKIVAAQTSNPRPLRELVPEVPTALAQVVARMMARDPADRFSTPAQLADALAPLTRNEPMAGVLATFGRGEGVSRGAEPAFGDSGNPNELPRAFIAPPRSERARPKSRLLIGAVALFVATVAAAFAVQKLLVVYPEGTLVVKLKQPDAEVKVHGREIHFEGVAGHLTARLPEGSHKLYVTKDGFETKTESFSITRGNNTIVEVELIPAPPRKTTSETPGEIRRFAGHTSAIAAAAFSADGGRIVSGGADAAMRVWDVTTGEELCRFDHEDEVSGVAVSSDGQRVLSGSWDKTAQLWQVTGPALLQRFDKHSMAVWSVAFSLDGQRVLTGTGGKRVDGRWVRSAAGNTVWLWNATTGEHIRRFDNHTDIVKAVAFCTDGRRVVSGSWDKTLRLWDVETGNQVHVLRGHEGAIWGAATSTDGRRAVSGSTDATARLWDLESGAEIGRFDGHTAAVNAVAISPDGTRVLTGSSDGTARLWDVATQKPRYRFDGHAGAVTAVAFAPDGQHVVSGGHDKIVRLWRAPGAK